MLSQLLPTLISSVVFLASHAPVGSSQSYECKFEAGTAVISHHGFNGAATVEIDGEAFSYVFEEDKLVPRTQGTPTYLFQPELKRWKLLNQQGETVEITVCKGSFGRAMTQHRRTASSL